MVEQNTATRRRKPTIPGSDTAWPIGNVADLKAAIKAIGRAKPEDRERVKRWIKKRARELGATNLIPDSWSRDDVMDGLEYREVEVREVNEEERTVTGLAVPYGEVIEVGGYRESFERGEHTLAPDAVLYAVHAHRQGGLPIGRIVEGRDTDEGFLIRAHISRTPAGDEVYTLLRDGVIKGMSVGFEPISHRMDGDVVVRTASRFREVSVTPHAAYKTAQIAEVRSEVEHEERENDMTEVMERDQDVADLRETVTELERRIALMTEERDATPAVQFRSGGEILKALAAGDENARTEFRDFGSTVEADVTRPGWISRPLKFVQEKRRVINLFSRAPLPPSGNSVEFPFVSTTTGTVGEQATEGAALPYMEVALDTGTSPVRTYGGYSSLSRQAIERSDLAYLDAVLRYQALQYAKATETAARTALLAVTGTGTGTLAADTVEAWIDVVIDAAAHIEDNSLGLTAEFMLVSRDVFKRIAHKVDTANRPVFSIKGDGQNTVGSANIVRASADIGGMPVVVDPTLAANTAWVCSSEAFTVLESGGAPFKLQDESIINLTKDFSLYGYMATTLNDANGLVKLDVDLVV